MDYANRNVSVNLKKTRMARNLSLEGVSEQTGVSKSMLGKIERGEANPSLSCLVKISSGLRVDLNELIGKPREKVHRIPRDKMVPTKVVEGQYSIYTYFPYEKNRQFEIYDITVWPGHVYVSGSHGYRTMEYITVTQGTLTLYINEICHVVYPGDALRFDTDVVHRYANEHDDLTKFLVIFSFQK